MSDTQKWINAYHEAEAEIADLRQQLEEARNIFRLARKWGVSSKGHSSEVALLIADWIDRDFQGATPRQPEYYPKDEAMEGGER